MVRATLIITLVASLVGCTVTVPAGEPVYEPPAVVEAPPVSVFVWWPWPHYEVEHCYVVENDHVTIHDNQLLPVVRTFARLHSKRQRQAPRLVQARTRALTGPREGGYRTHRQDAHSRNAAANVCVTTPIAVATSDSRKPSS
jgi:hypothetical protein